VIIHEIAHQWWGNSATEADWDDVWLSEGFATYFTHLYNEHFLGREAFVRGLKADINTIVQAQLKAPDQPVIHRNLSDMGAVLNRFVYQKGGWVLHMLRGLVGTETFRSALREYYRRYQNSNAATSDFRQVMEQASGKDLGWFFDQWLKRPGMPGLKGGWRYNAAAKQIQIEIAQVQSGDPYRLPLEVGITPAGGQMRIERIELIAAQGSFALPSDVEPANIVLDPNTWVLLQAVDFQKR
jgi:aminopeptidase N